MERIQGREANPILKLIHLGYLIRGMLTTVGEEGLSTLTPLSVAVNLFQSLRMEVMKALRDSKHS